MAFNLHIEVESPLSPYEFRERVVVPLGEALEREGVGHILDPEPEDAGIREGVYELALEVSDQKRARDVVENILSSMDS